jgi:phenylacetic acid degradation operon negative regulatory protein
MVDDDQDSPQPGRLIFTLYGLYARTHASWLPIAGVVRLMSEFGVDAQAVRSATYRLKRRGLLVPARVGGAVGYALADDAKTILAEGDRRIFTQQRGTVDDGWVLVVFSVPDSERAKRYQLRTVLTRLGFGTVSPGTWIAPRHLEDAAHETLTRAGLRVYTRMFSGEYLSTEDLAGTVRSWWDLGRLETLYVEFLGRFASIGRKWSRRPGHDAQAFVDLVEVLTAWRRLPYADPGLPIELLPANWVGLRAEQLFSEMFTLLRERAERHAQLVLGTSVGVVT